MNAAALSRGVLGTGVEVSRDPSTVAAPFTVIGARGSCVSWDGLALVEEVEGWEKRRRRTGSCWALKRDATAGVFKKAPGRACPGV